MRLAKYLAHAGVASRRASEEIVFGGRVTVAGEVVRDPARDVDGSEGIEVDGKPARAWKGERAVYRSTSPPAWSRPPPTPTGARPSSRSSPARAACTRSAGSTPDTTGLILLTDDGPLAHRLTHPSFEVPRVYRAKVRRPPVRGTALQRLRDGVELDDGMTAPARAKRLAPDVVELTIREGRKRQVRRMLDAVGHPVVSLERVAFGPLWLKGLEPGAHRRLTAAELDKLRGAGKARRGRR